MTTRWSPDEDALVLRTRHLTAGEVAATLGRSVNAVMHRRSSLGQKHAVTFLQNKSPHSVGRRRLLAKTCAHCGLLLEASRFGLNEGKWRSKCVHCRAVDEQVRKPVESTEVDAARARGNIQRLQALTIPGATRHRQPYTEADHRVLADPDLSGLEKALRLQRTYMATTSACSSHGYHSKTGQGDPIRGQWVIDNPNDMKDAA